MLIKKRLYVVVMSIFASFLCMSAANAQDPACPYTLASLQGSYAVIGTYGANVAMAISSEYLDGRGSLFRNFVVNQPLAGSTTGERRLTIGTNKGTYTVNCNGTGTFNRILTLADGTTSTGVDDFVITQAIPGPGWSGVATTIVDAQRIPSSIIPGGVFLTRVHTRLPETNPYGIVPK